MQGSVFYGLRDKLGAIYSSLIGVAKWGLNAGSHGITHFHHRDSVSPTSLPHLPAPGKAPPFFAPQPSVTYPTLLAL